MKPFLHSLAVRIVVFVCGVSLFAIAAQRSLQPIAQAKSKGRSSIDSQKKKVLRTAKPRSAANPKIVVKQKQPHTSASASPTKNMYPFTVRSSAVTRLKDLVGEDTLTFLSESNRFLHLTYATFQYGAKGLKHYLVLMEPGSISGKQTFKTFTITNKLEYGGVVFYPEVSADRRYILFHHGKFADPSSTHKIYVLDTSSGQVAQAVSSEISYPISSWSPDNEYIAYVEGGDAFGQASTFQGDQEHYSGPRKLFVADWRTGKKYFVTEDDQIQGPFRWLSSSSLLYEGPQVQKSGPINALVSASGVFEYSVATRKSRLLINNAFRALPSPDGTWLAFFGPENAAEQSAFRGNWRYNAEGLSLSVIQRDGTGRRALNRETGDYPSLAWNPDNQHLYSMKKTTNPGETKAEIREWDVSTGKYRTLAVVSSKDIEPAAGNKNVSFTLFDVTPDSQQLYFLIEKDIGKRTSPGGMKMPVRGESIRKLELSTGAITEIARFQGTPKLGNNGYSWNLN
jgi:hypothetical protein